MKPMGDTRIREAHERIKAAISAELKMLQAEGYTAQQGSAVLLTSLTSLSSTAIYAMVRLNGGDLQGYALATQNFLRELRQDGVQLFAGEALASDGRPLQ